MRPTYSRPLDSTEGGLLIRLASQRTRYLLGGALILIGIVRIVLTYPDISQTIDESSHISTGIEWLDQGQYTLNQENPPLPRIMVALGPYLSGAVAGDTPAQRVQVLAGDARYPRTLYLARVGTLVFFVVASLAVWGLGSRLHDPGVGLLALAIFTLLPIILGHSGIATTDVSLTAGYCGAILAFVYWVEEPSVRRSALLGLALGLVLLAKYTSVLFLGATAAGVLVAGLLVARARPSIFGIIRRFRLPVVVALATAFLVVWAGFRFSLGQLREPANRPYPPIDRVVGQSGILHDLAYRLMEAPMVPAPEMLTGIRLMFLHSRDPINTYLLGETRERGGFVEFFPVAVLVKTPIPVLVLAIIGAMAACGLARKERRWTVLFPPVGVAAVMLSVVPSGMSIGLRHILPIYSLLSIGAAFGVWWIAQSRYWERGSVRVATVSVLGWLLLSSAVSHPDYLSFFNGFAGASPEKILADSDLDWGQNVGLLAKELRKRNIKQVHLGLFTKVRLDRFEWPMNTTNLKAGVPTTGWIAASFYHIKVSRKFAWLEAHQPVDTIGKGIRLYYIPEKGKD